MKEQRTKEGFQAARARGRKGGRPKVPDKSIDKALKLYRAQTHSINEITEMTGVSSATLYRYLKQQPDYGACLLFPNSNITKK